MTSTYQRWLDDELSQEMKDNICREEGWPPQRIELLFFNGVKNYGEGYIRPSAPISGSLFVYHPDYPNNVEGTLVSPRGTSWIDGFLNEDEFHFIESYTSLNPENHNTTYSLKREGNLWVGTFEGTSPHRSPRKIKASIHHGGIFKHSELGRAPRPYIRGSCEPSRVVLDFLKKYKNTLPIYEDIECDRTLASKVTPNQKSNLPF
jgi:hypothetical protein